MAALGGLAIGVFAAAARDSFHGGRGHVSRELVAVSCQV